MNSYRPQGNVLLFSRTRTTKAFVNAGEHRLIVRRQGKREPLKVIELHEPGGDPIIGRDDVARRISEKTDGGNTRILADIEPASSASRH